jgi:hypothetical protein
VSGFDLTTSYLLAEVCSHTSEGKYFSSLAFLYKRVYLIRGAWGGVVVKALRYLSDVPGIDPRWCHLGFFSVFPSDKTMCPEVDSASENEYQGFLLG